jgi:ATP-binding cassette subfamily B protein
MESVFPAAADTASPLPTALASRGDSVLFYCGAYLVLALATGLFELLQRLWLTRFAAATVHDLRSAAVASVRAAGPLPVSRGADLVARIIGDSARLKADLKGILIHVSQNGLLVLAVTALFLVLSPKLGALFLVGASLAVLIGYHALDDVAVHARKQRRKESRYASMIQQGGWREAADEEEEKVNRSSARRDVRTTRIIGTSAILAHAALAVTISVALWFGVQDVRRGSLAPGELFLFVAYALTVHHRAVRIGRQVARIGKLLASAERICALISPSAGDGAKPWHLDASMRLEGVCVRSGNHLSQRWRLGRIDFALRPGERVAVLGPEGAGKSTLLEVLAGAVVPDKGKILWDGRDVTALQAGLRRSVEHIAQKPSLRRTNLRELFGLPEGAPLDENLRELLRTFGAHRLVDRLRKGLDQKLIPGRLSPREVRALRLCALCRSHASVWIVDEPVDTLRARGKAGLDRLLSLAGPERGVVVSLRERGDLGQFDRILVLKNGRVRYEGTPAEWSAWRAERTSRTGEVRAERQAEK